MTFTKTLKEILHETSGPLTPQELHRNVKNNYRNYFGTATHLRNVKRGHYKDLDHALLAQIYSTVRQGKSFTCDTSVKPMLVRLSEETKNQTKLVDIKKTKSENVEGFPTHDTKQKNSNEDILVKNFDYYYKLSLSVLEDFGGPSVYFHTQAIREQNENFLSNRHVEMIYGTLASWGMHRMGDPHTTKAKMVGFDKFRNSILKHRNLLTELAHFRMEQCETGEYRKILLDLKKIYYSLEVSISDATVVAHSKTLAHILPNLIPPIDRQYTVRFFTQEFQNFFTKNGKIRGVNNLPAGTDRQFEAFMDYCLRIKQLLERLNCSRFTIEEGSFNSSYPKIIDNLIMAFVKDTISSKSFKSSKNTTMLTPTS